MTDNLRDRIAVALRGHGRHPDDWTLAVAGAVIEALGADCIYRYACQERLRLSKEIASRQARIDKIDQRLRDMDHAEGMLR